MVIQDSGMVAFRAIVLLSLAFVIADDALADAPIRKENKKPPPAQDIFTEGHIPALRLEINGQGMDSLRRSPRVYVPATVREGTMVYTNVAIHLKGGPGSFRKLDDYPAFTLNFDRFAEGQRFHGLKKIHLNNSVQDRTYLSEKISRELFEAAGVRAPRAGHATVTLNGSVLGLYVLVEGVNKQFLGRYLRTPPGMCIKATRGATLLAGSQRTQATIPGINRA
jgi:spore coat protein CotH